MDYFKELLMQKAKEQKGKPDSSKMAAKMAVLKELKDVMSGEMGKDLSGMKKVSVMSNDEEGLKKGLEKAQELVDKQPDMLSSEDESSEEEMPEDSSHEMKEMLPDNLEEIEALMKMLEDKKNSLMNK